HDQGRVLVRAGPEREGVGADEADGDRRRLPAACGEIGDGELDLALAASLVLDPDRHDASFAEARVDDEVGVADATRAVTVTLVAPARVPMVHRAGAYIAGERGSRAKDLSNHVRCGNGERAERVADGPHVALPPAGYGPLSLHLAPYPVERLVVVRRPRGADVAGASSAARNGTITSSRSVL